METHTYIDKKISTVRRQERGRLCAVCLCDGRRRESLDRV